MRNKLILLLIVLIFVILILSAMVLYDRLGSSMDPGLVITAPQEEAVPPSEAEPPAEDPESAEPPAEDPESAEPPAEETEQENPPAPDFTVTDADGNAVSLSDFLGKPVILNFWASWCGPCKMEMPDFDEAFAEYGDRIHFVMVNLTDGYQETADTAKAFLETTDYTFPVYFDTAQEGAIRYGVSAVPVTYFLDAEGYFVAMGQGMLTAESLQRGIDLLLPEE